MNRLLTSVLLAVGCAAGSPAPVVTPIKATPAVVNDLALRADCSLVLASVEQGRTLLGTRDGFVAAMSPFDRAVRTGQDGADENTYLRFVVQHVRPFSPAESARMHDAAMEIRAGLERLHLALSLPGQVLVVLTDGREEIDAPIALGYTRAQAIVVNQVALSQPAARLIAHELFHVLSRRDRALQDRVYAALGYRRIERVVLPDELERRRITNPDAPFVEHAIRLSRGQQRVDVANVLMASRPYAGSGTLMDYLKPAFVVLQNGAPELLANGAVTMLAFDMVDGYLDAVGRNTDYVIQPEEVAADNFALLVVGPGNRPIASPDVLERIRHALVGDAP